ncbi:MAG: spermidine synthase [Candidatus Obscuribacterales bacterium]|nr:spermidine synthase [Candidatus Obscuribacterales bacterium]
MAKFLIVLLLFFFSGFSALIYQVVWQRILGLFTGVDVVSVALITSAYMLGMGVGSLFGGSLSERINRQSHLIFIFALAELVVGAFGALSKLVFYDFLYVAVPQLGNTKLLAFLALFVVLLLPTFFMGLTLPLLSKAFVTKIEGAVGKIALLYALNTLGASIGSVAAATVLIGNLGYESALYIAAGVNLFCALAAISLGFLTRKDPSVNFDIDTACGISLQSGEPALGFRTWLVISACAGFSALGLELLWFRLLNIMLKANSMTYGWLLFIYLFGLALGTVIGSFLVKRSKNSAAYFCLCQSLICIYAVVSISLLVKELGTVEYLQPLFEFFSRYNPIEFDREKVPPSLLFKLYIFLPAVLVTPPTVLMGASFCFLQATLQDNLKQIGNRVGWLQAANIAGSTLGSLFVGLIALQYFRTAGTLHMVLGIGCAFIGLWAFISFFRSANSRLSRWGAVLGIPLIVWLAVGLGVPTNRELWRKLHGSHSENLIVSEDRTGVAALCPVLGSDAGMYLFLNGQGHSELPYGMYHTQEGLLPPFLHPNPVDIAIIGLGSGDTLYASGAHKNTRSIICFEIIKPALNCLLRWNEVKHYPPLDGLIADPRVRIVFTDGRKGLDREGKLYDIIQQDPLRSFDAGAGSLYSEEYFKMLQRHLKPGGYAVIWSPTPRARATFISSFPYVAEFGVTLIGSMQPISVESDLVVESFKKNRIEGYLEKSGSDQEALLKEIVRIYNNVSGERLKNSGDINRDLHPKDEFMVPQVN